MNKIAAIANPKSRVVLPGPRRAIDPIALGPVGKRGTPFNAMLDAQRSAKPMEPTPAVDPKASEKVVSAESKRPVDRAESRDESNIDARGDDANDNEAVSRESKSAKKPKADAGEAPADSAVVEAENEGEAIEKLLKQDVTTSEMPIAPQLPLPETPIVAEPAAEMEVTESASASTAVSMVAMAAVAQQAQADDADALAPVLEGAGSTDPVTVQKQSVIASEAKPAQAAKSQEGIDVSAIPDSADVPADAIAAMPKQQPTGEQSARGEDQQQPSESAGETKSVDAGAAKQADTSKFDAHFAKLATPTDATAKPQAVETPKPPTPVASTLEQRFADDNVDNVVSSVRTQVTAGGGQMRIRLDPPELGALEVAVKMIEGRMTASFTTSNDQATQLLSHNLNNLKQSLEATGIAVDRIQVRQTTNEGNTQSQSGNSNSDSSGRNGAYDPNSRQGEQQRKEAVQRMWRKLAYGTEEVDLVA